MHWLKKMHGLDDEVEV